MEGQSQRHPDGVRRVSRGVAAAGPAGRGPFVVCEVGLLWWARDNLTLNIIMLIHPIDALKAWQMAGHAGS